MGASVVMEIGPYNGGICSQGNRPMGASVVMEIGPYNGGICSHGNRPIQWGHL